MWVRWCHMSRRCGAQLIKVLNGLWRSMTKDSDQESVATSGSKHTIFTGVLVCSTNLRYLGGVQMRWGH